MLCSYSSLIILVFLEVNDQPYLLIHYADEDSNYAKMFHPTHIQCPTNAGIKCILFSIPLQTKLFYVKHFLIAF